MYRTLPWVDRREREGVEAVGRIVKEVVADVAVHVEVRTDAVVEIAAVAVIGDVGHDAP